MVAAYGRLDEQITTTESTVVPPSAATYTFDSGTWSKSGMDLTLPNVDAGGTAVGVPDVGSVAMLSAADPFGQPTSLTATITAVSTDVGTITLTLDSSLTSISGQLTANIMVPGSSTSTTAKHWTSRRDFSASDQFQEGGTQLQDSRWLVRGGPGFQGWEVGDTFTAPDGLNWTVRGISLLGTRGEYRELLSRLITA